MKIGPRLGKVAAIGAAVLLSGLALAASRHERCVVRCATDAGDCVALCKKLVKNHVEVCTKACATEKAACTDECNERAKR